MIHGVDVSKWQGTIEWDVVSQKAQFAFIKASQSTVSDPMFERNWRESKGRIIRGAYHFWQPNVEAAQQAQFFINLLKSQDDPGELPPVLDLESSPVTWNKVQEWMDAVEHALGRTPILYTSPGFATPLGMPPKQWPLWIAHYGVDVPTLPPGWDGWTFWQYGTGNGNKYGVESRGIDLNQFAGDWAQLVRFCLGYEVPKVSNPSSLHKYRVTAFALRVRSGPGVKYHAVGRVWFGQVVSVYEVRTTDRFSPWGRIGKNRWISLKYAKPVK